MDLKTMTLWLGFLFVERIPALDGSVRGWLTLLEQLRTVPAQRVVPGNGPAPAAWPAALEPQQRYLQQLIDETKQIIDAGYPPGQPCNFTYLPGLSCSAQRPQLFQENGPYKWLQL